MSGQPNEYDALIVAALAVLALAVLEGPWRLTRR